VTTVAQTRAESATVSSQATATTAAQTPSESATDSFPATETTLAQTPSETAIGSIPISESPTPSQSRSRSDAFVASAEEEKSDSEIASELVTESSEFSRTLFLPTTVELLESQVLEKTMVELPSLKLNPTLSNLTPKLYISVTLQVSLYFGSPIEGRESCDVADTLRLSKSGSGIDSSQFEGASEFSESVVFVSSNELSESVRIEGSSTFELTSLFVGSEHILRSIAFSPSISTLQSQLIEATVVFGFSGRFPDSTHLRQSSGFTSSITFSVSGTFRGSMEFSSSKSFWSSIGFSRSATFTGSISFSKSETFTESILFWATNVFTASVPFTRAATKTRLGARARAEELTNGLVSGGAIGTLVAGLVVIGALSLLFLLLKRRKSQAVAELEEETALVETDTMTERENFISEYGLSEGEVQDPSGEDLTDMPRVIGEDGHYVSDDRHASEHNPDDVDEFGLSGDEM
jgi:hypothetical protein